MTVSVDGVLAQVEPTVVFVNLRLQKVNNVVAKTTNVFPMIVTVALVGPT